MDSLQMNTKQVIVIRKDLNMRKGKMCAQAAHASMSFLTKNGFIGNTTYGDIAFINIELSNDFMIEADHWLRNSFRKICVYVNSEQELRNIHQIAIAAGLTSHLIEDNGATEFNGVLTPTCCAIGPHFDSKFEGVTSNLQLL